MKSFDDWFKDSDPFCGNDNNTDCIWAKKKLKLSYEAGQQSRQAEVEGLQRKLSLCEALRGNQFEHILDIKEELDASQRKSIKLQKRIDDALFKIKRSHGRVMGAYLEDILKGESE